MTKNITFHQQVEKPKEAITVLPLEILHPKVKDTIVNHQNICGGEWLQKQYFVRISFSYVMLYTDSGHRIDIWL